MIVWAPIWTNTQEQLDFLKATLSFIFYLRQSMFTKQRWEQHGRQNVDPILLVRTYFGLPSHFLLAGWCCLKFAGSSHKTIYCMFIFIYTDISPHWKISTINVRLNTMNFRFHLGKKQKPCFWKIAPKATWRKAHHCSTSETTHISHALPSTAGKDRGAPPASLSPASPAAPHGPGGSQAVSERAEAVADFFLKAELPSCRALGVYLLDPEVELSNWAIEHGHLW